MPAYAGSGIASDWKVIEPRLIAGRRDVTARRVVVEGGRIHVGPGHVLEEVGLDRRTRGEGRAVHGPDLFGFAILVRDEETGSFHNIPTTAPPGYDAFILIDIDSADPAFDGYGSDPNRTTFVIPAPALQATIPEPSLLALTRLSAVALVMRRRRRSA